MSTARMIDQEYVNTGKVRVVSLNYPVHGEEAGRIAQATLCALDQGKFWEYHDTLFERLYTGAPVYGAGKLKLLAGSLGLDASTFAACLDDGKYSQRVKDQAAEAEGRGVTSTPTFFMNDTKIVGAKAFDVFKAAIDAALQGG